MVGAYRFPFAAVSSTKMQCFRLRPSFFRPLSSPSASKVFTRLYATPVTIGTLSPAPNSTHNVCFPVEKSYHFTSADIPYPYSKNVWAEDKVPVEVEHLRVVIKVKRRGLGTGNRKLDLKEVKPRSAEGFQRGDFSTSAW
jgi:hypothetical protein